MWNIPYHEDSLQFDFISNSNLNMSFNLPRTVQQLENNYVGRLCLGWDFFSFILSFLSSFLSFFKSWSSILSSLIDLFLLRAPRNWTFPTKNTNSIINDQRIIYLCRKRVLQDAGPNSH